MKKYILLFLVLLAIKAGAQTNDTTKYFKPVDYGWNYARVKARFAFIPPSDTANNKLGLAVLNTGVYIGNGTTWGLNKIAGVGELLGTNKYGDSTGHNQTGSKFDVVLTPPDVRIGYRLRVNGFDNRMPTQDIATSVGGIQNLYNSPAYGGIAHYGLSTREQAILFIGIAGRQAVDYSSLGEVPITFRASLYDSSNLTVYERAIPDAAPMIGFRNFNDLKINILGNGTLLPIISGGPSLGLSSRNLKFKSGYFTDSVIAAYYSGSGAGLTGLVKISDSASMLSNYRRTTTKITNSDLATSYLQLAGGTMSGAINMGSQNITSGGTAAFTTGTYTGGTVDVSGSGDAGVSLQRSGGKKWVMLGSSGGTYGWYLYNQTDGTIPLIISDAGAATHSSSVTATSFIVSSDRRLKNIIRRDGDMIWYVWKNGPDKKLHIGYVAQEVEKYMPDAVTTNADGMKAVNYIEVLVLKIRQLEKRIEQLEKNKK
jgi:hypothetical protein